MTIAVTTPTGNVGSHVVRMLYQAGMRPRLLLRNPDRLDADVRDQVELAVGDQRDADYVAEVTRGVEAIFWVHPDDWSLPDPNADAERTGEGLAAAMRENRCRAAAPALQLLHDEPVHGSRRAARRAADHDPAVGRADAAGRSPGHRLRRRGPPARQHTSRR